jgi:hypothetical protein
MKNSRFSEQQIIKTLKSADASVNLRKRRQITKSRLRAVRLWIW